VEARQVREMEQPDRREVPQTEHTPRKLLENVPVWGYGEQPGRGFGCSVCLLNSMFRR